MRLIAQSMDCVEQQFESRDNNIASLERRVEESGDVAVRLQADIFVLKHESSIFRSFILPCMWFWKCQTSSPWDKQYRA